MAKITVKNKDGTVNKKETERIKKNTKLMKLERKKDMFGNTRKKRMTEIPRDSIITGVRKVMSLMPGSIGKEGKNQLMLNRIAKEVDKQTMKKKMYGGKVTKRPMGGKVYKVDNSGQMMVQRMYGGKIKK